MIIAALALYLVLVTVADAQGLSYYSDESLERMLRLDHARAERRPRAVLPARIGRLSKAALPGALPGEPPAPASRPLNVPASA